MRGICEALARGQRLPDRHRQDQARGKPLPANLQVPVADRECDLGAKGVDRGLAAARYTAS